MSAGSTEWLCRSIFNLIHKVIHRHLTGERRYPGGFFPETGVPGSAAKGKNECFSHPERVACHRAVPEQPCAGSPWYPETAGTARSKQGCRHPGWFLRSCGPAQGEQSLWRGRVPGSLRGPVRHQKMATKRLRWNPGTVCLCRRIFSVARNMSLRYSCRAVGQDPGKTGKIASDQ